MPSFFICTASICLSFWINNSSMKRLTSNPLILRQSLFIRTQPVNISV